MLVISRVYTYVYVHTWASMHLQHIPCSLHARSRTYKRRHQSCLRAHLSGRCTLYICVYTCVAGYTWSVGCPRTCEFCKNCRRHTQTGRTDCGNIEIDSLTLAYILILYSDASSWTRESVRDGEKRSFNPRERLSFHATFSHRKLIAIDSLVTYARYVSYAACFILIPQNASIFDAQRFRESYKPRYDFVARYFGTRAVSLVRLFLQYLQYQLLMERLLNARARSSLCPCGA